LTRPPLHAKAQQPSSFSLIAVNKGPINTQESSLPPIPPWLKQIESLSPHVLQWFFVVLPAVSISPPLFFSILRRTLPLPFFLNRVLNLSPHFFLGIILQCRLVMPYFSLLLTNYRVALALLDLLLCSSFPHRPFMAMFPSSVSEKFSGVLISFLLLF